MKDYREMADNVLRRRDAYRMKRRKNIKTAASVLSCFCIMTVLGIGSWHSGILTGDDPERQIKGVKDVQSEDNIITDVQPEDNTITDTFDETKHMATEQEAKQSAIRDASADVNDGDLINPENSGVNDYNTAKSNNNGEAESTETEAAIDVPVSDIPGDTGALTAYDEVWGGCYMDQNGCWVVLLTEDTPENRQMVLTLNPTLREDNIIFQTAAYSKAYLTYLMTEISNAMCAGKLPLVTTAALREDKNCVEVTMISDDPWSVDKILAFDTAGGAIEILYDSEMHVIIDLEEYGIMDLIKDPKP